MSLLRLIFLFGIIYIVYRLVRKLTAKNNSAVSTQKTTSMVRCAYCDVYIVKQDAYLKDNKFYCDPGHYEKSIANKSE